MVRYCRIIKVYFKTTLEIDYLEINLFDLSQQTIRQIGCNACNGKYGLNEWVMFECDNLVVINPEDVIS